VSGAGFSARITDGGASLAAVQEALAEHLAVSGLPPRLVTRAGVIVEELVLNALRHGGAHWVALVAQAGEAGCELRFADDGVAFDPVAAPEAPRAHRLEEEIEGGRGLLLLRRFAAALAYERAEGENRLSVTLAV
jgi:anti-sigma regulatory factor (Ser/Thr protein kinase)